jgi:hypothetical protein
LYPAFVINPELEFRFDLGQLDLAPQAFHVDWVVPQKLSYFEGHFPSEAVLPAVGIVDATVELLRQALGDPMLELTSIKSAKFSQPIRPGDKIRIRVSRTSSSQWRAEWLILDSSLQTETSVGELAFGLRQRS